MPEERLSNHELLKRLCECPGKFQRWQHKEKGILVEIVESAIVEATCEPAVVYEHDGVRWIRPLLEFVAKFKPL